jgi:hypothetical protein
MSMCFLRNTDTAARTDTAAETNTIPYSMLSEVAASGTICITCSALASEPMDGEHGRLGPIETRKHTALPAAHWSGPRRPRSARAPPAAFLSFAHSSLPWQQPPPGPRPIAGRQMGASRIHDLQKKQPLQIWPQGADQHRPSIANPGHRFTRVRYLPASPGQSCPDTRC